MAQPVKSNNSKSAKELESVKEGGATPGAIKEGGGGIYLPKNEETIPPTNTITEHWEKVPAHLVSIPMPAKGKVSEADFLKSILTYQKSGGFGTHLDDMLINRVKQITGQKNIWADDTVVSKSKVIQETGVDPDREAKDAAAKKNAAADKDVDAAAEKADKAAAKAADKPTPRKAKKSRAGK